MAFNISFGTTSSEKRQLDKSVSYSTTVSGVLRNQTGVVNPTILVDANISSIAGCNYMSIPTFGRLYFITEIISISDDLCQVSGHCDVLSTYKTGIRGNSAVVSRSATQGNWNLYLTDPMLKVTNKSLIQNRTGWVGFPKNQFSLMLITMG